MKLYHGTSGRYLESILRYGIKPRGRRRKGNFAHTVISSPDHVYLTRNYSMHFACIATEALKDKMLMIEVDSRRMLPWDLHPDEDFLHGVSRGDKYPGPKEHTTMEQRTAWFRDHLADYQHHWEQSVEFLGNCCHAGTIQPDIITRYALMPKRHPLRMFSDPTITLINNRIMGGFYKALTAHVFGDNADQYRNDALEGERIERMLKTPRDGIEVTVHEVETA